MSHDLQYQIALTLIPGVGSRVARTLISYCGSLDNIFKASRQQLLRIPGIGKKVTEGVLKSSEQLKQAEKEVEFILKNNISTRFLLDKNYPTRLKSCADAPILLFYKGNAPLNAEKTISIVGTRKATDYGKTLCKKLVENLAQYTNIVIFSGLAYGIDGVAHKSCLKFDLPTVAVLAHGLDRIYPKLHYNIAQKMCSNGGLLTEFLPNTEPTQENFPRRNRIVAGLADATIVVETAAKGGSLITADYAATYNRDVYAFSGRITDKYSVGCNRLIKKNIASLIESGDDVALSLGWSTDDEKILSKSKQKKFFHQLAPEEQTIVTLLQKYSEELHIDFIKQQLPWQTSIIATHLLSLEFKGLIKTIPGSRYKLL